jgi:succinate dehydrogenase / fumarate reductase iron-sulfur subunit
MSIRTITFKVFRFNGETDYLPHYKEYTLDVSSDELILDVLNRIKWEKDGSFSYRRSCRHGICGACAVKVNDKSIIACKTNVHDIHDIFDNGVLIIDPSNKRKALKDLIIDKSDFWEKYDAVKPYLIAEIAEDEKFEKENLIIPEVADLVDEADHCIQCGVCYYACPAVEANPDYLGPAQFAKAYRFNFDVRDEAKRERLSIVNELGTGIWDCVKCYECAEACPKDVNPIAKITKLHTQTFQETMAENNVATRHAVGFKHSIIKHGILDEGELVRYSEGNLGVLKHLGEAMHMFKKGKIVMPWNMPKSKNLDEIKTLVENCSTAEFCQIKKFLKEQQSSSSEKDN